MDSKGTLRRRFLSLRASLEVAEVRRRSELIASRCLSPDTQVGRKIHEASSIGLYAALPQEVQTDFLFSALRGRGKRVAFPKTRGLDMEFFEVKGWSDLKVGRLGILEPSGESPSLSQIDLIFLPGVAFDERGQRLGFGKGYYDRFLSGFSGMTLGLAYDFQVIPRIPTDPWDISCDWVITETRAIQS